ncbi:putative signaling protein [Fundidesulfovibrio magnetotacticus]|uniref:Putative signaling protein n=1 Tax=Fundidesulfovibrio magnetotacticus TaxID=2730080 RepID=A0A6V8LUJ5_9BACT|nr:diguanylate cyclase [Fundidesulfovibrio magnetotacticus]GFK96073.1 putative signaling protein [Fundidesulfovibrio magnetotacticus]
MKTPSASDGKLFLLPALYFFLAMLWVLGSDALTWHMFEAWPPEAIKDISMLKGLAFSACTALFISFLLHRHSVSRSRMVKNMRRVIRKINRISRAHRRAAAELDAIFDNSLVGVLFADESLTVRRANRGFLEMMGRTREEVVGKSVCNLSQGGCGVCEELLRAMDRNRPEAGATESEFAVETPGGQRWMQMSLSRVGAGTQARGHVAVLRDVTERRRDEERIAYLSYHDFLTGLPNRRLFTEKLADACKRGRRYGGGFGVLYIDLNDFKRCNDTHGHEFGDAVLKAFTRIALECLRESDVLARLGGDEFAVILNAVEKRSSCEKVARKLQEALARVREVDGLPVSLSASMGAGVFPHDGEDVDSLLTVADRNMYVQKDIHRAGAAVQ